MDYNVGKRSKEGGVYRPRGVSLPEPRLSGYQGSRKFQEVLGVYERDGVRRGWVNDILMSCEKISQVHTHIEELQVRTSKRVYGFGMYSLTEVNHFGDFKDLV